MNRDIGSEYEVVARNYQNKAGSISALMKDPTSYNEHQALLPWLGLGLGMGLGLGLGLRLGFSSVLIPVVYPHP